MTLDRALPGRGRPGLGLVPVPGPVARRQGRGARGPAQRLFRPFWDLMRGLHSDGRAPRIIALENVGGAITCNGGRDFATLIQALAGPAIAAARW